MDNGELKEVFFDNGELKKRYYIKNGKLNGPYEEHNYSDYLKCNYENDLLHGKYVASYWHSEGVVKCNYEHGFLDGEYDHQYARGKSCLTCNYKHGNLSGIFKDWSNCSNYICEYTCLNGYALQYSIIHDNVIISEKKGCIEKCMNYIMKREKIKNILQEDDKNILDKIIVTDEFNVSVYKNNLLVGKYIIAYRKIDANKLIIVKKCKNGHLNIYKDDYDPEGGCS